MEGLAVGRVLTMDGLAVGRILNVDRSAVGHILAVGGAGAAADGVFSLLGLAFATLGILALAWWVSRWVGLHGGVPASGQGGEQFRVLGQLYLGRNERLVLVRFQDRCLLLGVTEHSITLLRELDDEESASCLAEAKEPSSFADILGGILRNGEGSISKNGKGGFLKIVKHGILKSGEDGREQERGGGVPQDRDGEGRKSR